MGSYSIKQKERLQKGLCRDCGQLKTCHTTLCENCKKRVSHRMKQRRKERKALGLCVDCGESNNSEHTTCPKCLKRRNKKQQIKRELLVKEGKCYECGSEVAKEKKKCHNCSINKKELERARRQRLDKKGLCISCGKYPCLNSLRNGPLQQRRCKVCYLKKRSSTQLGTSKYWKSILTILEKQNYKCAYSGDPLILGKNASIDHLLPKSRFPDKEHDIDNIQWVTRSINLMKNDLTHDEFLDLARKIVKKRQFGSALIKTE